MRIANLETEAHYRIRIRHHRWHKVWWRYGSDIWGFPEMGTRYCDPYCKGSQKASLNFRNPHLETATGPGQSGQCLVEDLAPSKLTSNGMLRSHCGRHAKYLFTNAPAAYACPRGPKRPHRHKDLIFWFQGPIQGESRKPLFAGPLC